MEHHIYAILGFLFLLWRLNAINILQPGTQYEHVMLLRWYQRRSRALTRARECDTLSWLHWWRANSMLFPNASCLFASFYLCTVFWSTYLYFGLQLSHLKQTAPGFTCKQTVTLVFRQTRVCLLGLQQRLNARFSFQRNTVVVRHVLVTPVTMSGKNKSLWAESS